MKNSRPVTNKKLNLLGAALLALVAASNVLAQSGATRPRRVNPAESQPPAAPAQQTSTTQSAQQPAARPAQTTANAGRPAPANATGVARAYALFQQKQYAEALKEARQAAQAEPENAEAWKIAGFAELSLKQYAEAAADLQRAVELQRKAGEEDPNTTDALAEAYARAERFDRALPILVAATDRKSPAPKPELFYFRGLAEFKANKTVEAERSFNAAIKADPKNAPSLFYLGRIAYDKKDWTSAISFLNRATTSDASVPQAWSLLTAAYVQRAATATGPKAEADHLAAIRASESLLKVQNDASALVLHGQALIRAQQFARAATALERAAADPNVDGTTLYLLGVAHNRAKNFPRAVAALERAAQKSPENAEVYRELGFAHEFQKDYAKALAAYERGAQAAPSDASFKESAERVRPFAKQ